MVKRKQAACLSSQEILSLLSGRLAGSLSSQFLGSEENVAYLLEMLCRTVDKGESNSLLVLGPRGAGKTALIKHVLRVAGERPDWSENVVVVKLSGLIQTDDKVALRDITKQLKLENVVGNKVFGSFAEHLTFLLASLKTGDSSSSKPIVFILEEFDSFCSHKNQTLLYNLFDVAQSRAVPICVIGISSQIDVTELLEKRVKSRFSHRHLYIWPPTDLAKFLELVSGFLTLGQEESQFWDSHVKSFFTRKDVKTFLGELFKVDKSIGTLKKFLFLSVIQMSSEGAEVLDMTHLQKSREQCYSFGSSNPFVSQLKDLSITEICLLIAIKHILDIYDNEPFNFEMVYHEFVKFKRRKLQTLSDERSVIMKCWENLQELELISSKTGGRTGQEQFALNSSHVPADALKLAVGQLANCPTEVVQWLQSSHHTASH